MTFVRTLCEKHFAGAQLTVARVIAFSSVLRKKLALHRPSLAGSLAGFVGVMLLPMLPTAYLLLSVVPKDLRFEVSTDAPISIRIDDGVGNEASGFSVQLSVIRDFAAIQSYREFLPPDVDARKLSCTFDCASQNQIVLKRIRLTVADFLAWDLPAEEFVRCYASSNGATSALGADGTIVIKLRNGSGTFAPKEGVAPCGRYAGICPTGIILPHSMIRLSAAMVAILIVFAIMGSCCVGAVAGNLRHRLWISLALSFLASVFVLVILPVQSFCANGSDYSFATSELLGGQILPVLITCAVLTLGFSLASFSFGMLPFVLALAFLAYEYLQTGVLSIGAPVLNGDMSYYANRALALRDGLVLIGVIAVFLLFSRWVKKHLLSVIGGFALLFLASAVDGLLNSRSSENPEMSSDGFCSKLEVLKNLKFSKRNVIVLLIDSVTTEVASDVFRRSPEVASHFQGFTVFENNIGMHHETDYATVGMLTGDYFTNRLDDASVKAAYLKKAFGEKSVVCHYAEMGASVYVMPSAFDFGLVRDGSSRGGADLRRPCHDRGECRRPVNRRNEGALSFSLRDMTLFRLAPFAAKMATFDLLYASASGHGRVEDEETVYSILKKSQITDDERTTFVFVHTHGAHCPHNVTRDGHKLTDGVNDGYDRYYDHVYFVLRHVGSLLDSWRENGVLDKSYVVFAADHGSHANNDTRVDISLSHDLPPRAHPMLCLKPFGASGALAYDSVSPTHHARLAGLLNVLKDRDLSLTESTERLISPNRLFVIPEESRVSYWVVDQVGKAIEFIMD